MRPLFLLLCLFNVSSYADPGTYVGVGGHVAWFDSKQNNFELDDESPVVSIFAGHRFGALSRLPFDPSPLIEIGYENFSDLTATIGTDFVSVEVSLLSVMAGAEVPISGEWVLVGKLGAVNWRTDIDTNIGSEDGWAAAGSVGVGRDFGQLRVHADLNGRNFFEGIWSFGLGFHYRF